MGKLEDLKERLSEKTFADVKNVLEIYAYKKYDYLEISIESWEKVIVKHMERLLKDNFDLHTFVGSLSAKINTSVRNVILKRISLGQLKMFNNLLLKISEQAQFNYLFILSTFLREFENLEIMFDSNIYNLLKCESEEFKKLLKSLSISYYSYEDFMKYIKKALNIDFSNLDSSKKFKNIKAENDKKKFKDKSIVGKNINDAISLKLGTQRRNFLVKKIGLIRCYYKEKSYSEEEFNQKIENIIRAMEDVVVASEKEYVSTFLDMLYTDLDKEAKRA